MTKFEYAGHTFKYDSKYLKGVLFIAISGAHSYGWATKESDLDVRLVWIPDLQQALSIEFRGAPKQSQKDNIDLVSYPLRTYLRLLVKGNGNALENLFQPKLHQKEKLVKELQELILDNLHVKFLKHFLGYSSSISKDLTNETRLARYGPTKLILTNYRVLLAGIILSKEQKVVYNLDKQWTYQKTEECLPILHDYRCGRKISVGSKNKAISELKMLKAMLTKIIDESDWRKSFPSHLLDRWLAEYYA